MDDLFHKIREHPWLAGAIVFVVGLIFVFYFFRGGSSTQAVGSTGLTPEELAAQVQMAQITAGANAAQNQTNAQLQALAIKNAGDFAIAQLAAKSTDLNTVTQFKVAQLDTTTKLTQLGDELQATLAGFANQANIANINADVTKYTVAQEVLQNTTIAQTQAQVQETISNNQAQVGIAQAGFQFQSTKALADANAAIAKAYASAQSSSSLFGGLFGAIGKIGAAAFA